MLNILGTIAYILKMGFCWFSGNCYNRRDKQLFGYFVSIRKLWALHYKPAV